MRAPCNSAPRPRFSPPSLIVSRAYRNRWLTEAHSIGDTSGSPFGTAAMKQLSVFTSLCLVALYAHAQTPECMEREAKLKANLSVSNACEPRHQTCIAMGPTNPMRELNYCQNLLRRCESLDEPIEDEKLRSQVEHFKKECSSS